MCSSLSAGDTSIDAVIDTHRSLQIQMIGRFKTLAACFFRLLAGTSCISLIKLLIKLYIQTRNQPRDTSSCKAKTTHSIASSCCSVDLVNHNTDRFPFTPQPAPCVDSVLYPIRDRSSRTIVTDEPEPRSA